jgi:hypothetical protein
MVGYMGDYMNFLVAIRRIFGNIYRLTNFRINHLVLLPRVVGFVFKFDGFFFENFILFFFCSLLKFETLNRKLKMLYAVF